MPSVEARWISELLTVALPEGSGRMDGLRLNTPGKQKTFAIECESVAKAGRKFSAV